MKIKNCDIDMSSLILGCQRIASKSDSDIEKLVSTALENGINFFDHADIYMNGESEIKFAKTIKSLNIDRESIIIQSKAGIKVGQGFDFSKKHILTSIDSSLKRLNTDYLDVFLLHRPDMLMEINEVKDILYEVSQTKKVKNFGVSNHDSHQLNLLNKICDNKFVINQLQMSITDCHMVDRALNVNTNNLLSIDRDGGMYEYSILNDITIQAWSPFKFSDSNYNKEIYINNPKFENLNNVLDKVATKYSVTKEAIVIAWLLRLPIKMQVLVGTSNVERLNNIALGRNIKLTRLEWYEIYSSTGKKI